MIVGVVCSACLAGYECKTVPVGCVECGASFTSTPHCAVEHKAVGGPHRVWRANYYGAASEAIVDAVTKFILGMQTASRKRAAHASALVREMWAACPHVPRIARST